MSMYYKTRASGGLLPMLRGRELGTACRNSNDLDPLLLTLSSDRRYVLFGIRFLVLHSSTNMPRLFRF